jgi:AcrR family transcriptional regulator
MACPLGKTGKGEQTIRKHKARQIARIVEAAMQLIHAEGLGGLNISGIAAAAGVTRQTVYNYFPDVESILIQALDAHASAARQHLDEVLKDADGRFEKLRALVDFQISIASPVHETGALAAGLSSAGRQRLSTHANFGKKALEEIIEPDFDGPGPGAREEFAAKVEFLWGLVEAGMRAAIQHPDNIPMLQDAVFKAMRAVVDEQGSPQDKAGRTKNQR